MFDTSAAQSRLERLWKLKGNFGVERGNNRVFLDEIVSDRMQLLSGLQVLRDELQFADAPIENDRDQCTADFTQPSVVTTLAFTNCGDRIHHGEMEHYQRVVATRFATLSEIGTLKPEAFYPTGGGTDDGATLAHVTWAHVLDEPLRKRIYDGNNQSFVLCAFDLKTHTGRDFEEAKIVYGRTRESKWREPRAACGAVVGTLAKYDERNTVHRRIRKNLGEASYKVLTTTGVRSKEGIDISATVASAIVAIQGMIDTAMALSHEMDERGLAHLTASMTINRPDMTDTTMYLARATVFNGEVRMQGLGTDASKYSGEMITYNAEERLRLTYEKMHEDNFEIATDRYDIRQSILPGDIFA